MILTKDKLQEIIGEWNSGELLDGTYMLPLDSDTGLTIVFGASTAYENGKDNPHQIIADGGHTIYTLVGKVAYNRDDLQCDYDVDWYMPCINTGEWSGEVFDTEIAITSPNDAEWLEKQLQEAIQGVKDGSLVCPDNRNGNCDYE